MIENLKLLEAYLKYQRRFAQTQVFEYLLVRPSQIRVPGLQKLSFSSILILEALDRFYYQL
jgi:hypothetical protein